MRSRSVRAGVAAVLCLAACVLHAAPDEAAHGAALGYPAGDRTSWWQQPYAVGSFTAMERLFPTRAVAAGDTPRALPRAAAEPDWPFLQAYLDRHPATGLLVVHDGRVLVERTQYGRSASDRFTSFSMAKTVVGMAVGVALAEGHIASIDDPVDRYEPALKSTAWAGVPIRHVLTMSSGVAFDEDYDRADSDIAFLSRAWTRQDGRLLDRLARFTRRDGAPGRRFRYVSADTQVLGQVLARATGTTLSDYVSRTIWQPMGAEADAAWVLDSGGTEAAYCCLSARLRDWARLGLLLLDEGQRDGRRIVPREWVRAATSVRPEDAHLQPAVATPYFGYGYQLWLFPGDAGFALLGIRGQSVFVHPRLRLVMVQTAVWPQALVRFHAGQRDAFWRELIREVGRR